jgi:hypothetical protein
MFSIASELFMTFEARRVILPSFTLTTTCDASDPEAVSVTIPRLNGKSPYTYYRRSVLKPFGWSDNQNTYSYNRLPIILKGDGSPWTEANLYILSRLESDINHNISTYHVISDDLSAYRQYLEEEKVDFKLFPRRKLQRPTYRYRGALKHQIAAREIAARTAQRKMGSIIQFYRWLIHEDMLTPEYPPWSETDVLIQFKNSTGFSLSKQIKTTNLRIHTPKQKDPYSGQINDMGQLRPLLHTEQKALLETLIDLGNYQMMLIHLLALFTGARIQTVLTLRLRHVRLELPDDLAEIRFPVGPGTGVDSKNDKLVSIFIPRWLYEKLRIYSYSNDAKKRRDRSSDISEDQYLFISNRGVPLYTSKADQIKFDPDSNSRYLNTGQNVRQFISRRVILIMREKLKNPTFRYKFHDLRATYGMNLTEHQLNLVEGGKITLQQAREFVKARMGHQRHETTDLYLNHKQNLEVVRQAQSNFEEHLRALAENSIADPA